MPTQAEILAGLARTANDWIAVAAVWHALLAIVLVTVASGIWRPSKRTGALALTALPASVALFAWLAGNPFNGIVFTAAAVALGILAVRLESTPLDRAPSWALLTGALAFTFAWVYPHFLWEQPFVYYAVAAPVGLIPCPTLSALLAFGLFANGFGSRAWSITAGALGLFYGVTGVAQLGVWLDIGLVLAAVATLALATTMKRGERHELAPASASRSR